MQIGLSAGERKAAIGFGAIVLAVIAAVVLFSPDVDKDPGYPSSTSAHSNGAKAAYLMLKESGYNVERWYQEPGNLPQRASGTLLLIAQPTLYPTDDERLAIKRYLHGGGRILAIGSLASTLLPNSEIQSLTVPRPEWKEIRPTLPSRLTRGGAFKSSVESKWNVTNADQIVHYANDDGAVVVSYRYASGEITWWATTVPLTNAGITEHGNLELLLNSIGDRSTHIYWDEYFHSPRKPLWSRISDTPLKWLFAQLAVFAGAALLTYSRRSGPLKPLIERSRLSPLEFIETLGGLYKRSRSPSFAIEVAYERFRNVMLKKFGIRRDATSEMVEKLCRERVNYKDEKFLDTLRQCESAMYDHDLSESRALELAQKLAEYQQTLQRAAGPKGERH